MICRKEIWHSYNFNDYDSWLYNNLIILREISKEKDYESSFHNKERYLKRKQMKDRYCIDRSDSSPRDCLLLVNTDLIAIIYKYLNKYPKTHTKTMQKGKRE